MTILNASFTIARAEAPDLIFDVAWLAGATSANFYLAASRYEPVPLLSKSLADTITITIPDDDLIHSLVTVSLRADETDALPLGHLYYELWLGDLAGTQLKVAEGEIVLEDSLRVSA